MIFTPTGLPVVLAHLTAAGWRIWPKTLRSQYPEHVNWYAGKRINGTRPCECNTDKPGIAIICDPSHSEINGHVLKSCPVSIIGEYNGMWYKLEAYTLRPDELGKLPEVEARLAQAWEALANPAPCARDSVQ